MADNTHNGNAAAAALSSSSSAGKNILSSQIEERLIAAEYKIWKKNTPFLYDFVMTHGLEWPSLTCQWLPTCKTLADGSRVGAVSGTSSNIAEQHELLIGTHTTTTTTTNNGGADGHEDNGNGGEMNYLMVVTVNLPRDDPVVAVAAATVDNNTDDSKSKSSGGSPMTKKIKTTSTNSNNDEATAATDPSPKSIIIDVPEPVTNYNEEKDELGGYSHVVTAAATSTSSAASSSSSSSSTTPKVGKIEIKLKIPHDGEVNRARYMPQNHFIVSTRGPSSDVYIWDLSKHSSILSSNSSSSSSAIAASASTATTNNNNRPNPNVICRGHEGEGYGMAWCSIAGNENYGKLITFNMICTTKERKNISKA